MVLNIRDGDEFIREIIKVTESKDDIISGYGTRDEALAYIAGSIGTMRIMALDLLEIDVSKGVTDYLDKREDEFRKIADKLPYFNR